MKTDRAPPLVATMARDERHVERELDPREGARVADPRGGRAGRMAQASDGGEHRHAERAEGDRGRPPRSRRRAPTASTMAAVMQPRPVQPAQSDARSGSDICSTGGPAT